MIRTALFVPASRPRAITKARELPADLLILDLEDAVAAADKAAARENLRTAFRNGFGNRLVAVRVNGFGSIDWEADRHVIADLPLDYIVLPKVEHPDAGAANDWSNVPLLAMIESAVGVLAAPAIARMPDVAGVIAGTNDLAASLHLTRGRAGLALALQSIVLAARAAGVLALDGVFNRLDDPDGLAAECAEGRAFGFDGKTLIHPDQIAIANAAFAPTAAEIEEAQALVAASTDGAERFRGRMVEAMHVAAARHLLDQVGGGGNRSGGSL